MHLRKCMSCGHVGCCDNSPHRHATAHFASQHHPLIQSCKPGEDWWYCYIDHLAFAVDGAASFAHPMSVGPANALRESEAGAPRIARSAVVVGTAGLGAVAGASLRPVALATPRGKLTLAVLCVVGFLALVAVSLPTVALPTIQRDLHLSVQSLQWIPSAYLLTLGGFMLLGGRATDLFGHRRLLVGGITIFATSSLVAGLAANSAALIGARLAHGLGGALMLPAALST